MVICIGLVQAPARAFPRPARNDGRSGPVHTMSTSANGWHGAPIEAPDFGKIGSKDQGSSEESNEEWRARAPVPFGLLPKEPMRFVAKPRRAACPASFRASRMALLAVQRTCGHSVNRPL